MLSKRGCTRVAVAAFLALAACGGGKKKTADNVANGNGAASGLWALTPASAAAGFVVEDGALQMIQAGFVEMARIADGHPITKQGIDELRQELADGPFDPMDPASYERAGIDLGKGLAVWASASDQVYAVLPIADPAKFAGLAGGRTVNEGGVDIDLYGDDMRCTTKADRYVCAQTAAALAEIGTGTPGPLAQMALDATVGGQVRVVIDPTRYPVAERIPGLDRYLTELGALALGATLEPGGLTVRAHLPGKLVTEGQKLAAAPSLLAGKAAGERPSGAMHVRIDPRIIPVEDGAALPNGVSIADLVNALTGEIMGLSHAGASGSMSLQIGLANAAPIRQMIEFGCTMAGSAMPNIKLRWEKGSCRGSITTSGMPSEVRRLARVNTVDVDVSVDDDKLDIRLALGDRGPITNAPSPSKLGGDMIAGSWNVSAWGEGLSPVYLLDLLNMNAIPYRDRPQVQAALWALGHLYEAGVAVGFRDDGLHGVMSVKTFAGAPEEEYKGYQAALKRAVNGDWEGAKSDLDALAQKSPGGMVARQVGLKSGAWLGIAGLGGVVGWLTLSGSVEEPVPPAAVAPPM